MAPFYGWGSTASRSESLQKDSLLFTLTSQEIPDTPLIEPPSGFEQKHFPVSETHCDSCLRFR